MTVNDNKLDFPEWSKVQYRKLTHRARLHNARLDFDFPDLSVWLDENVFEDFIAGDIPILYIDWDDYMQTPVKDIEDKFLVSLDYINIKYS